MRRQHWLTILFLLLAGLSLLGVGALRARHTYLTRGIPDGFPQPVHHAIPQPGLNVYLNQYNHDTLNQTLDAIEMTGVTRLKQPFFYAPDFAWGESNQLVTAVTAPDRPFTLVPLLDGTPDNNFAPVNPADFAAWAGDFAARYGDQIRYYIIWDEPNLAEHWGGGPVNPIEYAALLSAAAEAIRAADEDAVIVAAPLAPTSETGPDNLADDLYLQRLYEAGAAPAFDVVAAKPYGFDTPPDDRRAARDVLNFSRPILLREVMVHNGDGHKAIWAGNWGWNALPPDWEGPPSIWGETTVAQQATWTPAALARARREWPWMGVMFLENWQPPLPPEHPRWGFSIAGRITADALATYLGEQEAAVALPGYHLARPDDPAQFYEGGWRFSPEFGADISPPAPGKPPDEMTFTFWGTDVGLRVRRADFRARLYVTVDGEPANALPQDENGSALVLTAADPAEDYMAIEPVATGLEPGRHVVHVVASRGWDQWALHGFSVAYHPPHPLTRWGQIGLAVAAVFFLGLAIYQGRRAEWGWIRRRYGKLDRWAQLGMTAALAAIVALSGWLTWSAGAEGVYRRLGDGGQLALTAGAAAVFYVSPTFLLYAVALALLFLLITLRPAWGLALVAFSSPFYVRPKPMLGYLFSPVEIFMLVTAGATIIHHGLHFIRRISSAAPHRSPTTDHRLPITDYRLLPTDYAVLLFLAIAALSLLFTERLDVATNEWRVVILEPALFYAAFRLIRPSRAEMWIILDAFVLGGVVVAGYGLWQFAFDREALIAAEGGLLRLTSIFGSPNNVGLYLGRIWPLLGAVTLLGERLDPRRRWAYAAALLPVGVTLLFTFSKGALFLGIPAGSIFVFWRWRRRHGRSTWPWLLVFGVIGTGVFLLASQIPALAGRLDWRGVTTDFRVNLWRSSLSMIAEHPLTGVGLDNFLYAYRGRYILDAAWQEPDLNHPHNILLDFATRLGLLGVMAGGWLLGRLGRLLHRAIMTVDETWRPVAVGFGGAFAAMLAHGLVDQSFFLVDLAFVFYLMLATAVSITTD